MATSGTTFYWSSTTFRFTPGYAWGAYFDVGFVHTRAPKDFESFIHSGSARRPVMPVRARFRRWGSNQGLP